MRAPYHILLEVILSKQPLDEVKIFQIQSKTFFTTKKV